MNLDEELAAQRYALRLYVTGSTPRSTRAVENIRRIAEQHIKGCYDLDIVDIYAHPEAARDHQIVAAPTLVRILPEPVRRIIGDLADEARVISGLDLPPS